MLHCGWRGLAGGIVGSGVELVGASAAAIGPGIGRCCFEVGAEVLERFGQLGEGIADGRMLDLPEVARRLLAEAGVTEVESSRPLHELRGGAVLLPPPRSGPHRAADRPRLDRVTMPEPITGIDPEVVRANLERVREAAGDWVEVLAATKYVPVEEMGTLAEAGVDARRREPAPGPGAEAASAGATSSSGTSSARFRAAR